MLRRLGLISLSVALLLPLSAAAESTQAGFPSSSIWLSSTAPTSGQAVTVYAVVYNSTDNKLESTIGFMVDTKPLSTMSVSLAPGASQIYSTQWTAAQGAHSFSASLSGTTVSDVTKESGSVSITVAAPPAPSATQQTVTQTTAVAATIASTSLPIISKVSQTIYNTTEGLREKGLAYMEAQSGAAASTTAADKGSVLGTSTARSFPVLGTPKTTGFMAQVYAFLIIIFASRAYFYPVFLILILFILWLLMKWVNKPRF